MGMIVAFVSGKGGVGKTTITAVTGVALARKGYKVLVADGDFGLRDLDLAFGKENQVLFTAYDAWKKTQRVRNVVISISDNLDLLPASQDYRWEDLGRKGYGKLLERLSRRYDYVLVDAPAGIGRGFDAILRVVDRLVVVTEPYWGSMRDAQHVMAICRERCLMDYAVVINRMQLHNEAIVEPQEALFTLGEEDLGALLPVSPLVEKSMQNGVLQDLSDADFLQILEPLVHFLLTGQRTGLAEVMELLSQLASHITPANIVLESDGLIQIKSNDKEPEGALVEARAKVSTAKEERGSVSEDKEEDTPSVDFILKRLTGGQAESNGESHKVDKSLALSQVEKEKGMASQAVAVDRGHLDGGISKLSQTGPSQLLQRQRNARWRIGRRR